MHSLLQALSKSDTSMWSESERPVLSDHFKTVFKDIGLLWSNEETGCKIYKAKHKTDGCLYAVKKIEIPKGFEIDSQKRLDHYIREVKILTQFDHQNIVKYHQCWIEEEEELKNDEEEKQENSEENQSQAFSFALEKKSILFLYIQMEYCTGGNLAAYLRQKEVTPQKAKQIFIQVLQGMKQVHSQNIIHRDLKPENIFVDEEGNKVKIGDFGLSLLHDLEAGGGSDQLKFQSKEQVQSRFSKESNSSDLQLSSQSQSRFSKGLNSSDLQLSNHSHSNFSQTDHNTKIVGTPLYCSPEQQTGKKYGKETDIFALGLIFYQILGFPKSTDMEKFQLFTALREELNLANDFELRFPLEADIIKSMAYFYPSKRAKIDEVLFKLTGVHDNGPVNNEFYVRDHANIIKKDEKAETLVGTFAGKGQAHIWVIIEETNQRVKIEHGITSNVLAGGNQNKGRKLQFSFQSKDHNGLPINPRFVKYLN